MRNAREILNVDFDECESEEILTSIAFENRNAVPIFTIADKAGFIYGRTNTCNTALAERCIPLNLIRKKIVF